MKDNVDCLATIPPSDYRLSFRQGPRSGSRRPTGYPQQLRRFTLGSSLRQEQSSSHEAITDNGNLDRAPIRYFTEELRPDQNYRHGNEPSTKDSLGLDVLGEPAEVLILRDKENRFRLSSNEAPVRASGPDENPAQEQISSSGMLEEMDAERGIVDIDDACKHIESVRASWAARTRGSINGIAYNDLVSRLQGGFTKRQLGAYFDRAGKDPAADIFDLSIEFSNHHYARSSWQLAGNTPPPKSKAPRIADLRPQQESKEKGVPGKERGHGLSKEVLVKRILRRCWNITPRFQESSSGELDIRLQRLQFNLILNHKRDILKLISRSYDSKVEAWPQEYIIRITSDYDNCVDIIKLLLYTLDNIKTSTIDLDVDLMSHKGSTPPPRELNDVMLRQIEEYTNTLVRTQGDSYRTLRVWYIGPDDADLLETRRLIDQILRPGSAQNHKLAWSKGGKPNNATPAPVEGGSRLSLVDRSQQWSRWCNPQIGVSPLRKKEKERSPPSSASADPAAQIVHGKLAFDTVKSFFEAPDDTSYRLCNNVSPYWTSEIEYHDSVKLGQVLFPAEKASLVAVGLENKVRQRSKTGQKTRQIDTRTIGFKSLRIPRVFLPLIPGLLRSLESIGPLKKSEEFLQIRLSPSSKNVSLPVPVEALPNLEIRISFDYDTKTTSIKDVRLVTAKEKDFLQPQNVVDLRFTRKQCVYAKEDRIDPRILSFVQNSTLDLWGEENLKTPPGLSLSIPALAIQSHNGFTPESNPTLLVDYTSFGLEHRTFLTMAYKDPDSWPTLTYTNIEAGRIGGKRDELSLQNLRFASKQLPLTDPGSSAVSIDEESLSNDDHTSILFHKTASLIEGIERAGKEPSGKGLAMPEFKRWRRRASTFRKIDYLEGLANNRPGYLAPVNETVRRVVSDRMARPVAVGGVK
ncbi:MAG: hypothetical protein ASARMPRED_002413 [Alectoria sarmentosa]|nr:MAG: hypothetical protein ASARMPRED_002413 [Alectoria sarmentosa]